MTTRRILGEVAAKGIPCDHCRCSGSCGCGSCIQHGGVCGKCGGMRFLPRVTLNEADFSDVPPIPVRFMRRPKKRAKGMSNAA